MRKYALILAGGDGRRAGGDMPKQFRELLGIPMLWWSVRDFHRADPDTGIIIVMHPGFFDDWDILYQELPEEDRRIPVELVCGGRDRVHSALNGLMAIPVDGDQDALVAVHDAARPLLTADMINRCWDTAARNGCAVPCVPEVNSLRKITAEGTEPVKRDDFLVVQTPQVFRLGVLQKAYSRCAEESSAFTDDASMVQACGEKITICEGSPENIKVTTPGDFTVAEALLRSRQ